MKKVFTKVLLVCGMLACYSVSMASKPVEAVSAEIIAYNNSVSINAYPNPSSGITKFSLTQSGTKTYRLRISDAIGKVVHVVDGSELSGNTEVTVDLSALPPGIYFYSLLVNDKMVETKRLILQR